MDSRDLIILALLGFGAWYWLRGRKQMQAAAATDGTTSEVVGGAGMNLGVASAVNTGMPVISGIVGDPSHPPPAISMGYGVARPPISPTTVEGVRLAGVDNTPPPPPPVPHTQGITVAGVSSPIGSGGNTMGPLPVRPPDSAPLGFSSTTVRSLSSGLPTRSFQLAPLVNPNPF